MYLYDSTFRFLMPTADIYRSKYFILRYYGNIDLVHDPVVT